MKKATLILLALVCALVLAACSGSSDAVTTVDVAAAAEALKDADIAGEKLFAGFRDGDAAYLTDMLGIDASRLSSFAALLPTEDADPNMALLLVPADGERDNVKNELANAMASYEKRWDNYLPEKAAVVHERMETEVGDCLVLIISPDNDAALDAVRSAAR